MKHRLSAFHCLVFCWVFRISSICHGRDTLEAGQVLRDGEFLESSSKLFQLKFFKLEFSENRYLGIQMQDDSERTSFVWVANRDRPLMDRPGVLNLTRDGILIIDGGDSIILNVEHRAESGIGNISLTILDTGNLVLRVGEEVTWQSFDYPTDTWLLGMKLGLFDLKSRRPPRRQFITSWFSPFLPASGPITLGVDPDSPTELTIWRRGKIYWQSSNWIEIKEIYGDMYNDMNDYRFDYISNENESYFALSTAEQSGPSFGITMNSSGAIDRFTYFTDQGFKNIRYTSLIDLCGSRWTSGSSGLGCASIFDESLCLQRYAVFAFHTFYVEGNWTSIDNSNLSITDCEVICMRNCSCTAYSPFRLDGSGCNFSTSQKFRFSEKVLSDPRNNPLFVRIFFPIISVVFVVLVISCGYLFVGGKDANRRRTQQWATGQLIYELRNNVNANIDEIPTTSRSKPNSSTKKDQQELPLFSFSTLKHATDGFSIENKIGQGGFGPVYKGKLGDGREIAVKRLSRSSGQGTEEFKNEVILISKLQHRSLVRLLGCCIQAQEKLLVYEYMPNKSLYSFLFDEKKRLLLDWRKRFSIIEGIAQGLLYLHKYSRLRIIHRDLKTSNILLDSDLNPKIADFGLARSIGDDETQANTMNIAGTRGYMSPEYAMGGLFSEKSDVFSFGVMVLEIISGKKNASFYHSNIFLNLLGYAWDLWREERFLELLDPGLEEAPSPNEVTRCVQIGLLCVQENAVDRPNMTDIVSMLINESNILPTPKKPAFLTIAGKNPEVPTEEIRPCSINVVTISSFGPR